MEVNGVNTTERGRRLDFDTEGTPMVVRASDGFGFDILQSQPGQVWCRSCLAQLDASNIEEHVCVLWWTPSGKIAGLPSDV
jgi:hypothetical protein